ncbi:MAG: hypothetical protein IT229_03225 [Flavobacteriales bacterium]|nr:hypothetical protein [Flavobacteriales bacterium]
MRSILRALHQTLTAGLFLLLPLAVTLIVVLKVMALAHPLMEKVAAVLGVHDVPGIRLLLIGALLLLCLVAGLLVRARRVSRFSEWLENNVLRMIPGYEYLRMRMAESLGHDADATDRAILARIDDGWAPGMLIERGADGRCTVFMPDVPQCNSGGVYIVEADQVKFLHVRYGQLNNSIRNYGKGLQAMEAEPKA